MDFQASQAVIQLGRGSVVNILDAVRNLVLDWAIEMEKKGVLGEGMSFGSEEQAKAKEAMSSINIEKIEKFTGILGSDNVARDITSTDVSVAQISDVVTKIKTAMPELVQAGVEEARLGEIIAAIEEETKSASPSEGALNRLLGDLRAVLQGTAGNITAEGALALIAAITSAL